MQNHYDDDDLAWIAQHPQAENALEDMLAGFYENQGRPPTQGELSTIAEMCRHDYDLWRWVPNAVQGYFVIACFVIFVLKVVFDHITK